MYQDNYFVTSDDCADGNDILEIVIDPSFADYRPSRYFYFFSSNSVQKITGLEYFDISEATDLSYLFAWCYNLKDLDLRNFDTSNVMDMSGMFSNMWEVREIDLSSFNTQNKKLL